MEKKKLDLVRHLHHKNKTKRSFKSMYKSNPLKQASRVTTGDSTLILTPNLLTQSNVTMANYSGNRTLIV